MREGSGERTAPYNYRFPAACSSEFTLRLFEEIRYPQAIVAKYVIPRDSRAIRS